MLLNTTPIYTSNMHDCAMEIRIWIIDFQLVAHPVVLQLISVRLNREVENQNKFPSFSTFSDIQSCTIECRIFYSFYDWKLKIHRPQIARFIFFID